MEFLKNFFKYIVIKIILIIQLFKYKIFRKPFSKSKLELIKHRLNFYSFRLYNRKPLTSNYTYSLDTKIPLNYFNIRINKFIGYEGSYLYEGSAPLLKSAIEIFKNPSIGIEESYLYNFYEKFQPKNYGELYKLKKNNKLYDLPSSLDYKPWLNERPDYKKNRKGIFGPPEINELEHRLTRLKNLFKNIEKFGYLSTENDVIEGYLLLFKDDYKFLITSGHHRVAVLKTLNMFFKGKYDQILVKLDNKRISKNIVDIKNIQKWPGVISSYCSDDDALEFFYKYCFT